LRFLDLDLDFFLNKNAYAVDAGGRPGAGYRPWPESRVRRFLEDSCGLSCYSPIPGRIVEKHDGVLAFWGMLVKTGRLAVPFEVAHVDAHPDFSVRGGLYLSGGRLRLGPKSSTLGIPSAHPGNYLNLALSWGWLSSLVWVPLAEAPAGGAYAPRFPDDAPETPGVPFEVVPRRAFHASGFNFLALSISPDFTPPSSDLLLPAIREYMELI
jgi:hypothetical protein